MRFKATITDCSCLSNVLQVLEKLGQNCIIHLQPEIISFYLTSQFSASGQAFVELRVSSIFDEYRLESKTNNEIPMLVNIPNLARAIQSGVRATKTVIKLTKKNERAYLTFEITENVNIIQDVPITMQTMKSLKEYQEPELPEPEIQTRMPHLGNLKTVIDRMKAVSDELTIEADSAGRVVFRVETDLVKIKTHYKDLAIRTEGEEHSQDKESVCAHAKMSIKKFSKILHCRSLPSQYVLGCIVESRAFVLYVKLQQDQGHITYYIPLIAD